MSGRRVNRRLAPLLVAAVLVGLGLWLAIAAGGGGTDANAGYLQFYPGPLCRFAPSAILSLANHSWISVDTGVACTNLATARSNDCCAAKSSVRFARDTAVRIRRSGAFAFAIGAQSASVRRPRDNRFIPRPPPAQLY